MGGDVKPGGVGVDASAAPEDGIGVAVLPRGLKVAHDILDRDLAQGPEGFPVHDEVDLGSLFLDLFGLVDEEN